MTRAKSSRKKAVEADPEADFELEVSGGEIIPTPIDLRSKAKERKIAPGEKDPVAAAEAALKRMEKTFSVWIVDETEALVATLATAEGDGYGASSRAALFRSAHDIKGQAATLGFPLAGRVAGSLCLLLDHVTDPARIPRDLVRQHVQAVRAIVVENARDETNPVAKRLAERLDEVTDDYLSDIGAFA